MKIMKTVTIHSLILKSKNRKLHIRYSELFAFSHIIKILVLEFCSISYMFFSTLAFALFDIVSDMIFGFVLDFAVFLGFLRF